MHESSIVVFKNLPRETSVGDVDAVLKSIHMVSTGIDRKVDSMGGFRGTIFVRFATPEIAIVCCEKLENHPPSIHGKKVKVELLKRTTRGRSFSAKEALEAGDNLDSKLTNVRDIVSEFVQSNRNETHLPANLDAEQRKLAHSLAEKFGLSHATVSAQGSEGLKRSVYLSKSRAGSRTGSMHMSSSGSAKSSVLMSSFLETAAAANEIAKLMPMLPHAAPDIPVYAVAPHAVHDWDHVALMHAAQAQAHAEAAKQALGASKHGKEVDAMPAWLEIIATKPMRKRTKSNLNADAPEFIPSVSFMNHVVLTPPPGLSLTN